ncbi:hypothetical protein FNU76_16960 [Chitinimonas arctica]|uniref:Uncharacterized protein n=2 Tax=Chitinimonas arctica TaxID=2594795 RepID=A0A516SMT9_9NEIS|nr:hypothetical protein FNU76_16960 [Chitinimonas arctica]
MSALPAANTDFPGAGCLLCLAAASVANSKLTTHTKTLGPEDLPKLKQQAAELIRKKGAEAVIIEEPLVVDDLPSASQKGPNQSPKDFAALKAKYGVDKLFVFDIQFLGMQRPYSSYIPSSDPKAVMLGFGYLVNLSNNSYEWFAPVNIVKSSEGAWDEAPAFPGLTNAYYQVVEAGKDAFLKPLAN